jgi:LAO/AO transport system kinase
MVHWLRENGRTIGVLAVDPSSPLTGGALLGDRIRMQGFAGDTGVFFRSMASRGALGGLARAAEDVCVVMEAAGREVVVIETVGVGQAEVEVAGLADVTVLVLVPGMGDEVQSLKAGVMETADVFVVNKSDREGAELVEAGISELQGLSESGKGVPVVRTVATTGAGVVELMEVVLKVYSPVHNGEAVMNGAPGGLGQVIPRPRSGTWGTRSMGGPVLDHLGVAVKSIAAAKGFYESLGLRVEHEETVEFEQVKTAMLPMGESRIELLEATAGESVIGRFVAKRGEGLHHVALRVNGVDAMFARLKEDGVRLASDAVRIGAGGHRYFFVHPESTGGVLVEIVGSEESEA